MTGMRTGIALAVALALAGGSLQAGALEGQQAVYESGTVKTPVEGSLGHFDKSGPTALEFVTDTGKMAIPYAAIVTYNLREENRFHLGVLPSIAVSLVKKRAKRRMVVLTWKEAEGPAQVAAFEVTRATGEGLMEVLEARAVKGCKGVPGSACSRTH